MDGIKCELNNPNNPNEVLLPKTVASNVFTEDGKSVESILQSNLQIRSGDDIDSMVKLLPWGGFNSCVVSNNPLLPTRDAYIVFSYDGHGVAICINKYSFGIYRGYQTSGWIKEV